MNDASLVAVETGGATVAAGEGRVNPLPVVVDDVVEVLQVRLGQFQQVHGHVSAVPSRRFFTGSGDEHRRAEELRVPGQTEVAGILILGFLHAGSIRARGKSRPWSCDEMSPVGGRAPGRDGRPGVSFSSLQVGDGGAEIDVIRPAVHDERGDRRNAGRFGLVDAVGRFAQVNNFHSVVLRVERLRELGLGIDADRAAGVVEGGLF